jgi:hypothetical protein
MRAFFGCGKNFSHIHFIAGQQGFCNTSDGSRDAASHGRSYRHIWNEVKDRFHHVVKPTRRKGGGSVY